MPTKFVNILETSKLRIRGQYLDSVSYGLLHFLTLRLYENLAPVQGQFSAQVIDKYDTDNNKAVDLVYLDFQKTFNKVPHKRLMVKVNAHGIQGDAARWIRNWLAGRCQRVCINQSYSNCSPVTSGVPQGSVLGQLLFLIYINYLDTNIVSKILNFATELETLMT